MGKQKDVYYKKKQQQSPLLDDIWSHQEPGTLSSPTNSAIRYFARCSWFATLRSLVQPIGSLIIGNATARIKYPPQQALHSTTSSNTNLASLPTLTAMNTPNVVVPEATSAPPSLPTA
ncbi:unnamed protein product [Prunus armeniaca]|uniref:Uncharacterized protein n=1 Tax=Prunus armeniaca TaxID=36596 RepID=A0A6J5Y9H4_PRUAR|nr:unnamed protein product [Prunus armeniaca]